MCLPLTRRERIVENRRKRVWIASNRERYNAYMRSYKARWHAANGVDRYRRIEFVKRIDRAMRRIVSEQ